MRDQSNMAYEQELAAAIQAAKLAGEYIRKEYELFTPIPNAPVTISTHVDHQSQDLILNFLSNRFPDDSFCAEEKTATLAACKSTGQRMWVVDPIDGTRGFAMKNGQFSVMIAMTLQKQPVVGVVYEPTIDRLTYATYSGGCFMQTGNSSPMICRVSSRKVMDGLVVVKSHSKPGSSSPEVAVLAPTTLIETYSAGVKLAIVARGEADIYPNDYSRFSDWDICAGQILVTEAGGKVTQLRGEAVSYGNESYAQQGGLLATNGLLHEQTVQRMLAL